MDVRNWKRVLLLWISEFEYTDKSYNNVEQSDVEAFYEHIRQQHQKISENVTLLEFLQEYYSAYRPHVDDQNELSSADYVYVYSLLLHFTCVKQPESYFQEKCRKLANAAQEAIALFFKLMLECPLHNKENLRHIIGEVAGSVCLKLSPKHLSDAGSSGTPSPAKTPLSKTLARISPSTPKTMLLDERTKELFNLRAELENERYEKSEQEAQIRDLEYKISKLNNDCKKYQQQILDLKNKIRDDDDNTSTAPSEAEEQTQIIRRLQKEIKRKDFEMTNLTENLCSLRDEVLSLNKQLDNDKENLKQYRKRLEESECKIDEMTHELEKKNTTIKYLNDHKNELEHYIGELRSNSRKDMNNSSDCLDSSLMRSFENMSSVVEIQLSEKVQEIEQLQQDLLALREQNTLIIGGIKEQATLIAKNFNLPMSNIMSQEQTEAVSAGEYFQHFSLQLKELNQLYLDDMANMRTLQDKLRAVNDKNVEQAEHLASLQEQLCVHKDRIEMLESESLELTQDKVQLEARLGECVDEITKLLNANKQALNQLESTRQEYASLQSDTDTKIQQLAQQVEADKAEKLVLQNQQNKLRSEIGNYRILLQEAQEQNVQQTQHHTLEIEKLTENINKLEDKLQQHTASETLLKEKYEKVLIDRETLKKEERQINAHLDKMQTLLNDKEKEMLVLGDEINEVRALNTELEKRMEELTSDFKLERKQTEERIAKFKEQESKLLKELADKNALIAKTAKEAEKIKTQINAVLNACDLSVEESDAVNSLEEILKTVNAFKQEMQNLLKLMEEKQADSEETCTSLKTELDWLEKRYEEQNLHLKEQLDSEIKEKEKLEKELKIVIEKHNDAKTHLKQMEKTNKQLQAEFTSLEKEYLALKQNHDESIGVLQEQLEQKDKEIASMRMQEMDFLHKLKLKTEEVEHMKLQQEEHAAELIECKRQIESLQLNLIEQRKEIIELKEMEELEKREKYENIHHLNEKFVYLEQELAKNSEKFAKQQKEHETMFAALGRTLEETKAELKNKEELLSKATNGFEKLQRKFKELQLKEQQTQKKLNEKENEFLELQTLEMNEAEAQKELREKYKKLQQDYEEQQALVERTDATLLNILATLENVANSVKELVCPADDLDNIFNISQLETTQPHLQDLKRCLNKLVFKLTLLEREVEANQATLEAKNNELMTVTQSIHSIKQETEAKTTEFSEKLLNSEKDIDKLESEVKNAVKQTQDLKADLQQLYSRLQQTDKEKQQLKENLAAEKLQREELQQEVIELTDSRNAFEKKLNSSSVLLDKCMDLKQQAEVKLSTLEETHQKLAAAHEKLEQELRENEEKLLKLEEKHNNLQLQAKTSQEKLNTENGKLNKRIEHLALKLGEAQAHGNNLEREQKKLTELQSQKDKLLNDNTTLKERLARNEAMQEQLAARVAQLETVNGKFQLAQKKLQDEKDELQAKLHQVQRQRETQEEKIRKLNADLAQYEQNETRLKLEVGGLNSQLEVKREMLKKLESERKEQLEKQNAQAKQMEDLIAQVAKLNLTIKEREDDQLEKLEMQIKTLKIEHEQEVKEFLNKLQNLNAEKESILQQFEGKCEEVKQFLEKQEILEDRLQKSMLAVEMKERELLILRTEKAQLEAQLNKSEKETEEMQEQRVKQLEQEACLRKDLETKLSEKIQICTSLEKQLKDLEKTEYTHNEQLSLRLSTCEEMLSKEQEVNAQLRTDNQILQAKYAEAKQRLQENIKASEERIKENRLELEGKLEKMKNKMKTLYSEEITKIKSRQEREVNGLKIEIETLKAQNMKHEERSRKLTTQIVRMNDDMMENKRQQELLSSKLQHLQDFEETQFKHPKCPSIHSATNLHQTLSTATSGAPATNTFAMEDEEGEVFNNTYLTDLKTGRMSELMGKNVGAEELQYRNSLVPPHLKSTYAAQYDHGLAEDEMKDSAHAFDDSMSGLLTGGGVRKKISGATHYKRPGPPTPSKHGGRLSLGGNSEPPREILKEYNDNSNSKTPARFGFFGSRFSIGKDENNQENEGDLRKLVQLRNFELKQEKNLEHKKPKKGRKFLKSKSRAVCTSTPRKSKTYYDQQRTIEKATPTPPTVEVNNNNNNNDEIIVLKKASEEDSYIETPLSTLAVSTESASFHKKKRRQSRQLSRLCYAVSSGGGSSERRRNSQNFKIKRYSRPSFYLRGNMFAYARSPTHIKLRDMNRIKAQNQRRERYNTQREILSSDAVATPKIEHNTDDEENSLAKLVTTQDLLAFDKNVKTELFCDKDENDNLEDDWVDIDVGNSVEFERLLHATHSQAPFEIKKIAFDGTLEKNSSNSTVSTISNAISQCTESDGNIWRVVNKLNTQVSAATQLSHVTSTGSAQLSRTIYGGSVIFNRRIPNVSSTHVRKSSIYIKNKNASSTGIDDIILVTDQTITIADLARMWKQMNNTTRVAICFVCFASLSSLYMLITSLFK